MAQTGSHQKADYRFSPAGMERLTASTRFSIPWSIFGWISKEAPVTFIVIQKRMFADKMQADEFKTYVERHLPCEEERG
jgi:hypothetical protein